MIRRVTFKAMMYTARGCKMQQICRRRAREGELREHTNRLIKGALGERFNVIADQEDGLGARNPNKGILCPRAMVREDSCST